MRMPSHSALCSFIFSAILTSAFVPSAGDAALASAGAPAVQTAVQLAVNAAKSAAFAGNAAIELPTPVTAPAAAADASPAAPGSVLYPELLAKLLQLVSTKGTDRVAGAPFANALGLTPVGQGWPDRQVGAGVNGGTVHAFIVSRGTDQDIVLYAHMPTSSNIFRANRDGKVVSALNYDSATRKITMLTLAEAQPELDAEFQYWSENVDHLLAGA